MEERTVEITVQEYTELIQLRGRVEATLAFIAIDSYCAKETVKAILTGGADGKSGR